MLRLFFILGLLSQIISLNAQSPTITIKKFESATPYTNLEINNKSSDFQFAVVTDRTGGHRPGVFMDGVNKLNLLQPEFVMSVGDLIEGYTEDASVLNAEWNEFDSFVNQLEMPFFYVPGNHDITNEVMEDLWIKKFGTTYYHFIYQDVLFLCLNSEDQKRGAGRGTISDKQYDYIAKTLEDNKDVRWTLVFLHQPLWVQKNPERWPDVEKLLSERNHNVFAGHYHHYVAADRNNGKYIMLATTGGGSNLRGPQLGEFDHFVWVTMKDNGPIIANIALNGVFDENLITAETEEMIDIVEELQLIELEPLVVDNIESFESETLKIKVTNNQDFPIKISFEEKFNWNLIGKVKNNEILVNPNSVEFTELTIAKRSNSDLTKFEPFQLESTLTLTSKEGTEVQIPSTYRIEPIEKFELLEGKKKQIDANLKDWEQLEHSFSAKEKSDVNVDFGICYDKKYLYVVAKVIDDDVLSYGKGAPWNQDYIGFAFNAEPIAKSAMSVGADWYSAEMYFLQTPENDTASTQTWPSNKLPEGSEYKCVETDFGYIMECKIPLDYIKSKQGKDWKNIRFNMMVGDHDTNENEVRSYWQHDWRGEDNIIGSGTFFKN